MNELDLLTTQDVVEITGKSVATICRWVEAGKLSAVHKGRGVTGAYLFTRESVESLDLHD
jgi:predicted site-specific integrase-resolvase